MTSCVEAMWFRGVVQPCAGLKGGLSFAGYLGSYHCWDRAAPMALIAMSATSAEIAPPLSAEGAAGLGEAVLAVVLPFGRVQVRIRVGAGGSRFILPAVHGLGGRAKWWPSEFRPMTGSTCST